MPMLLPTLFFSRDAEQHCPCAGSDYAPCTQRTENTGAGAASSFAPASSLLVALLPSPHSQCTVPALNAQTYTGAGATCGFAPPSVVNFLIIRGATALYPQLGITVRSVPASNAALAAAAGVHADRTADSTAAAAAAAAAAAFRSEPGGC